MGSGWAVATACLCRISGCLQKSATVKLATQAEYQHEPEQLQQAEESAAQGDQRSLLLPAKRTNPFVHLSQQVCQGSHMNDARVTYIFPPPTDDAGYAAMFQAANCKLSLPSTVTFASRTVFT